MVICRLKELATAKGLNKSQVQKRTGLDLGLVRRYWDDDTESFKRNAIDKLCALLDCEPGDLIKRTPAAS